MESGQHISEAEWQVMRAVWDAVPTTSAAISIEMADTMGWEPTTVKTLLSRLVKKGALRFESKGRTYYYYPLITEDAFIQNEMNNVVEKVYGGSINKETAHLDFRGYNDQTFIELLADTLEEGFANITMHLDYTPTERIRVYTHATQKRLHSALGLLDGPDWLRGGHIWGILHLAPRVCFTEIAAEKAALHSMTQLLINKINPSAPYWLQQAISAYEGKWLSKERIDEAVRNHMNSVDLSKMKDMSKAYIEFKETNSYELAYTVAEFMVLTYGFDQIARLLRDPSDFLGVFGCTEDEFWSNWRGFIVTHYSVNT